MEKNNQAKQELLNKLMLEISKAVTDGYLERVTVLSQAYQRIASVNA